MNLYQVALTGSLLAFVLAGTFGRLRLLAYGIFLHGILVLVGSGLLLWQRHRRLAAISLLAALGIGTVGADAFLIEPHWLEIRRFHLSSTKLQAPLKVALLADFQTDEIGEYELRVLRRTLQEKPDLILFAGDYIQEANPERYRALGQQLRQSLADMGFSAPLGVIAVGGNADSRHWPSLFEGLSFTLVEETTSLDLSQLRVTALSMTDSFQTSLKVPANEAFHIVLGHAPDFALGQVDADLLVAGHIHGGQVRLPWIGPLITFSQVPRSWSSGLTHLDSGAALVVSRGIGMERLEAPRLRFLCRPELVFIDLLPTGEPASPGG
ncbi:MAG: metallophosphoesterase [Deltaproteobacteria bacterium]|nr:metallophosphoesterase [Deltaproteobacteria bacterium]